jgi:hypothetical protein
VSELARSLPTERPRIGFASVLVIALAASFVAWVLVDRNEPVTAPATSVAPQPETPATAAGPRITSVDGLSALAGLRGEAVYWVGPRPGAVYEVTENAGRVYVRYLTGAAQLGSPEPDFLAVASYPRPNAYADIEAAAKRPGAVTIPVPNGLAVFDRSAPTSVYVAYRGSSQQIEVYAPSADEARRLVERGFVQPVP